MQRPIRYRLYYLATALPAVLAACGGGGTDEPPTASPALEITSGNAALVTKTAWNSANDSADMAGVAGTSGLIASAAGDYVKPGAAPGAAFKLGTIVNSVPFGPQTLPCAVAGSITIQGDLADPLTLSPGDFISVEADMCDDGLGEITDGLVETTVETLSGDFAAGLFDLAMTIAMTDFKVTTPDDEVTGNGGATVSLDTLAAPFVAASISGSSISVARMNAATTLTNFLTTQTLDAGLSPSPYTLASSGTIDTTELPGIVEYSTPVTFEGFGADLPGTGVLEVEGLNSSARLIAVDSVNVLIEIDTNNDGVVDETIETSWDALTQ